MSSPKPLRLWPAVVIAIVQVLVMFGAPLIAPDAGPIGMLGGIGFTMSLFIGMLAFNDPTHAAQLRLGVLAGSLLAAAAGYLILRITAPGPREPPE